MKTEDAKKIISTAIDREVEAYTFYRGIADKVKDANLKKLFTELAGEEKKHREFLQGMLTKDISTMKFDASHDYKIADMLPSPPLTADLKPIDGIVISIRKELEAMQMYSPACEPCQRYRDTVALFPAGKHGTWSQGTTGGSLHKYGVPRVLVNRDLTLF